MEYFVFVKWITQLWRSKHLYVSEVVQNDQHSKACLFSLFYLAILRTFLPILRKIQIKLLNTLPRSQKIIDTIFSLPIILCLLNFNVEHVLLIELKFYKAI